MKWNILSRLWGIVWVRVTCIVASILLVAALALWIQTLLRELGEVAKQNKTLSERITSLEQFHCGARYTATAGTTTLHELTTGGVRRTYSVHTPAAYDPQTRYPVIINFDGIGGSGKRFESFSGIDTLPVIAVYPNSLRGTKGFTAWQGAPYSPKRSSDVAFVRDLIKQVSGQYCVDSSRIFAVGMSNGGGFAVLASCRLGGTIKAVASVAGAYYTTCADSAKPASLLAIHGTADKQVPFLGSKVRRLPSVRIWADEQAQSRQCESIPRQKVSDSTTRYRWIGCTNNSSLELLVINGAGHGWLTVPNKNEPLTEATARYIWQFFERQ